MDVIVVTCSISDDSSKLRIKKTTVHVCCIVFSRPLNFDCLS